MGTPTSKCRFPGGTIAGIASVKMSESVFYVMRREMGSWWLQAGLNWKLVLIRRVLGRGEPSGS